jgi:hypothetical protein
VSVVTNYAHIEELDNPVPEHMVLFSKPNSAISTQLISFHQEQLHYEAEMCFLYEDGRFSAIGLVGEICKEMNFLPPYSWIRVPFWKKHGSPIRNA